MKFDFSSMAHHHQHQSQSPPPQPLPPVQSKMIIDSRSRDIRRRIDVIQKKIADLQDLGVPCAFTYTSARNTGSIFTVGDSRVTDVIEHHKNEILKNLMDGETVDGSYSTNEIHMILPPLPAPLEELNRTSLQTLITGILKDLGLRWTDPRPNWWPPDVPFVAPRSTPENFSGSWTQALKRVLESVYSYFSYDVNTYIATKLETWARSPTATEAAATVNESLDAPHREVSSPPPEEGGRHAAGRFLHGSTSSSDESAGARGSSSKFAISDSSSCEDSRSDSGSRKPPNKSISSFTVENILMGRQRSSSSSDSPTTTISGGFSTPPPSHNSGGSNISTTSTNNHSSVVGTNWVSHPPVKYTKFTMLSPTSMADETQRKKKTDGVIEVQWRDQGGREMTHTTNPSSSDPAGHDLKRTPSSLRGSMVDLPSACFPVSQKPKSFSRSSSSGTPSSFFHKSSSVSSDPPTQHALPTQNLFQTATKVSALPVVQAVPAAADVKAAVLHQTFPASGQQVVLLIPSNSTSIGGNLPTVFYTNPILSLSQSTGSPSPATPSVAAAKQIATAASPPTTNGIARLNDERGSISSSHQHHRVIDRAGTPPHDQSGDSYRPIAPKSATSHAESSSSSHDHHDGKNNDRMKLYLKRTMPKPPKLRFHMTTVMKQPTGNTVMTSLTAQSPQAITSDVMTTAGNEHGPLSVAAAVESEQHLRSEVAVESTITRSPNIYSNESSSGSGGHKHQHQTSQQWMKQEHNSSSSSSSPTSTQGSPISNIVNCTTMAVGRSNSPSSGKNVTMSKAQTTVLKDSGFHLQLVKQQQGSRRDLKSQPQQQQSTAMELESSDHHMVQKSMRQNGRQQSGPGRGRGRATRSYTRRKRELTFHLYEDPSTAFRAKRQCRDKEPQH